MDTASPSQSAADRQATLAYKLGLAGVLLPLAIASIVIGLRAIRAADLSNAPPVRRKATKGIVLSCVWLGLAGFGMLLPIIDPNYQASGQSAAVLPKYPAESERVAGMTRELVKLHLDSDSSGFTHSIRVEKVEAVGDREYRARVSALSRSSAGEAFSFTLSVRVTYTAGDRPTRWEQGHVDGGEAWWLVSSYTEQGEQVAGARVRIGTLGEWRQASYVDRLALSTEMVGLWLDRQGRKPADSDALKPLAVDLEACLSTTAATGESDTLKVSEAAAACCVLLWPDKR
jgi:hypothetical protein